MTIQKKKKQEKVFFLVQKIIPPRSATHLSVIMSELRQIVIEGLVAAADIGLIVLCYKMLKDKCAAADKLEVRRGMHTC